MASKINEDLMKTNLDLPDGEIKLDGVVNPVYADAINVHNKKKKETEKILKDKKHELKKPFLGTKGETTVMPRTSEMKKLKLSEDMFRNIREHYEDAPDTYQNIFRIVDNMEHIINYINELSDEEMTYEDMQQSYDVLEGELSDFSDCLFELRASERRKGSVKEAVATPVRTRKDWELQDKRNNKDIWSDIYNELVDMKDIETPHRQLKKSPKHRYSGGWDEEGVRVAPSRTDDAIVVYADDESQLVHAKEVADAYGVEFTIREHTSRYAEARFEMKIYPTRHVANESLDTAKAFGRKAKSKDLNESANGEIYSKVVKYFEYGAPGETVDTVCDIVDRAISNIEDGYELDEAIGGALDSGLIYHKDLWAIKHYYEDSELLDGTYESLYNDIYSITSDLVEDDDVDEGLTSAQRYNRKMDKIFQDKRDRDSRMSKFLKDNSDITDDELKKVQDDDKVGLELKNRGLHDRYWNEIEGKNESLKESYTKVDTIECGEDTYRVVGGGFNPTADALVTVEDEHGERTRMHIGDVIEFYTWYDRKGNVIHEPIDDDFDESLNEAQCNYVDKYKGATIYECDGKYAADVNGTSVSGKSLDEIKKNIDKADTEYKKYFSNLPESLKKRSKRGRK